MEGIVRLFEHSGVRVCFSGHEHNFQHSRHNGIDYFVTGAGSKLRSAHQISSQTRTHHHGRRPVIFCS